jgi:hypothetical protein
MATPSPATAMFYFYINGLRFNDDFFIKLKIAYSVATIIAMLFFYFRLRTIAFKTILSCSNLLYFSVSLFSLILVTR